MKLTVVVYGSPRGSRAAESALAYTRAALESGHEIYRVFFYGEGVFLANQLASTPRDECDLLAEWQHLGTAYQLDLVVCIAAALKRGVLDRTEAKRWEKPGHNLAPGFTLSGLGQLIDACQNSARVVTFGD